MRRREFIAGLGSVLTWPVAARAQQPALPVIGYLSAGTADSDAPWVTGLRRGLDEGGYTEGRNVEILFRFADERFDRLPMLASDLVQRRVALIVASGGAPALAAKMATTTIPIVFETVNDPVAIGLVARFNRPGGNITGTSLIVEAYYSKGVELLHELLPHAGSIALLVNPTNSSSYAAATAETADAARARGLRLTVLKASNPGGFEQVFKTVAEEGLGALLLSSDRLFAGHYDLLAALALRFRVPWIDRTQQAAQAGALMTYGANITEAHRFVGNYATRILKGEKAADLPVQRATKIGLTVNLKTAKALGLTVPQSVLLRADEVIE
jgi:putative ABC transport system substrate-binding protein